MMGRVSGQGVGWAKRAGWARRSEKVGDRCYILELIINIILLILEHGAIMYKKYT